MYASSTRICFYVASLARTKWIKRVPGGWSALTRTILHDAFIIDGAGSTRFLLGGATVTLSFWALVADEEVAAAIWNLKRASGISPWGALCSVTNEACSTDVADWGQGIVAARR